MSTEQLPERVVTEIEQITDKPKLSAYKGALTIVAREALAQHPDNFNNAIDAVRQKANDLLAARKSRQANTNDAATKLPPDRIGYGSSRHVTKPPHYND